MACGRAAAAAAAAAAGATAAVCGEARRRMRRLLLDAGMRGVCFLCVVDQRLVDTRRLGGWKSPKDGHNVTHAPSHFHER